MQIVTNTSMSQEDRMQKLAPLFFAPASWFKAHPDYLNYLRIPKEFPIPQQIHLQQLHGAATWTGTCNALSSITQPTLVIVGTDDHAAPDSLTLAEGIPGSWLIRIRDAGHGLMYQHPDEFNTILNDLLRLSQQDVIYWLFFSKDVFALDSVIKRIELIPVLERYLVE